MAIPDTKRARILELREAGLSFRQIAAEVRVSPETARRTLAAAKPAQQRRSAVGTWPRAASLGRAPYDPELAEALLRIERKQAALTELRLDREGDLEIKDLLEREREAREQPVLAMLQRLKREQEARRASNEAWAAQRRALEEQRELGETDPGATTDKALEQLAQARQDALNRRWHAVGLSPDLPIEDLLAAERKAALRNRIGVLEVLDRLFHSPPPKT